MDSEDVSLPAHVCRCFPVAPAVALNSKAPSTTFPVFSRTQQSSNFSDYHMDRIARFALLRSATALHEAVLGLPGDEHDFWPGSDALVGTRAGTKSPHGLSGLLSKSSWHSGR